MEERSLAFDRLSKQYIEKFGEQFPNMLIMGGTIDDWIEIMERCIESGKPYKLDLDPDVLC